MSPSTVRTNAHAAADRRAGPARRIRDGPAAVDLEELARDRPRLVGEEEDRGPRDLVRIQHLAGQRLLAAARVGDRIGGSPAARADHRRAGQAPGASALTRIRPARVGRGHRGHQPGDRRPSPPRRHGWRRAPARDRAVTLPISRIEPRVPGRIRLLGEHPCDDRARRRGRPAQVQRERLVPARRRSSGGSARRRTAGRCRPRRRRARRSARTAGRRRRPRRPPRPRSARSAARYAARPPAAAIRSASSRQWASVRDTMKSAAPSAASRLAAAAAIPGRAGDEADAAGAGGSSRPIEVPLVQHVARRPMTRAVELRALTNARSARLCFTHPRPACAAERFRAITSPGPALSRS